MATAKLLLLGLLSLSSQVFARETSISSSCTQSQKSPALAGVICGARGTLTKKDKVIKLFTVGAGQNFIATCRNACFDYGNVCQSIGISPETGQCRLIGASLTEQGFKQGSASTLPRYYEKSCFEQTCQTVEKTVLSDNVIGEDDTYFQVNLPWPVLYYKNTFTTAYVSTNGFISFGSPTPQSSYVNVNLPVFSGSGASYLPPNSLAVYWDDLFVKSQEQRNCFPDQEISYSIYGPPYQRIRFSWKAAIGAYTDGYIDAYVEIEPQNAGIFSVRWPKVVGGHNSTGATIGAQSSGGQYVVYSFNEDKISSNDCINLFTNVNVIEDNNC